MFLIALIPGCAHNSKASDPEKERITQPGALMLNCTIISRDFSDIKDTTISQEAVINALKHKPGGAAKVTTIEPYEFWVMVHSMMLGEQPKIINFQVAIKDRRTNQFMHALSNTSIDGANPINMARISLVEYYPDSMLEKGELLFECR
jgi:hypothetical protein